MSTSSTSPTGGSPSRPPLARRGDVVHREHGVDRPDPYAWLRDTTAPETLEHLAAERGWYDAATAHLRSLVEDLRSEMARRVPGTEVSPPWLRRGFYYYTRHPAGSGYAQLLRESRPPRGDESQDSAPAPLCDDENRGEPDVLLDVDALRGDADYVELGERLLSPDQRLLAYSSDTVGDEVYTLRFRDLASGEDLADVVPRTYYGGAWSADSASYYYTVHDEAYRPHQVWRHRLGTPVADDVLVLGEEDERFELLLEASRSGDVVLVTARSRDTTEVWALDARDPDARAWSVGGRRAGVEYWAEHARVPGGDGAGTLLLVTDDGAVEFRLARCPVPRDAHQDATTWGSLLDEDPAERLEQADAFAGHVVLTLRREGRRLLRVLAWEELRDEGLAGVPGPPRGRDLTPSDPVGGTVELGHVEEYDTVWVPVTEQSYVRPAVTELVHLGTGERVAWHRAEAPGHDPDRYRCRRVLAPSVDGTPVPATLVAHRDTPLDGTAPALLYGYGAYEAVDEPAFDPALPSLLDRGVVYVHTHVRGGGEGGRRWWLDGRMQHKQHTFDDHGAVADHLAEQGLVDGSRIATRGLSAGGLLQGVVFSQRPQRWRAVVAEVPFVDVVTTMFDASIPLTVNEWEEWGDPHVREQLDWLLAYSPYDNPPPAGVRPDLLVTGALHDPRVMVWEPAKWVALLRETDPAWSPRLLFRCELGAGAHTGPSGRFGHLAYEAEIYAWLLDRLR